MERSGGVLVLAMLAGCAHKGDKKVAAPVPDAAVTASPQPTPVGADWSISVGKTDFGVGLVEHDTVTVRSDGSVEVQPPAGAAKRSIKVTPRELEGLALLLARPDVAALESAVALGEGTRYAISIGPRALQFSLPAPEAARRLIAAVDALARKVPGAPLPKFTVISRQVDLGGRLREHDTVTVRSTGAVEIKAPGGKQTDLTVPTDELKALAELLTHPDLPGLESTLATGEGSQWSLQVFTDLGPIKLSFASKLPDLAAKVIDEIARLRERALPATTLRVAYSQNLMGATAALPTWLEVRSTGDLELRPGGGQPRQLTVPAGELDKLLGLLDSPDFAALQSVKPSGEGLFTWIDISKGTTKRKLEFFGAVPPAAAPVVAELERLKKRFN